MSGSEVSQYRRTHGAFPVVPASCKIAEPISKCFVFVSQDTMSAFQAGNLRIKSAFMVQWACVMG